MSVRHLRLTTAAAAVALVGATLLGSGSAVTANAAANPRGPLVKLQILSFNDFHGNLEPPAGSGGRVIVSDNYRETSSTSSTGVVTYSITADTVDAGGVGYLATHLAQARQGHENTVTVAAGDIVGASPLLSAAFHDEPTIEAMNNLGLEATAVGNHEFDEGYRELQRLATGGCLDDGDGKDNQDSCPGGKSFTGADFQILAANVKYADTGETILPPYWIKNFHGAKVGFIGMTLKETPTIVTQAGIEGLEFTDEVATANALVPVLKAQGVNAIVVLLHQGATPLRTASFTGEHTRSTTLEHRFDWACADGPGTERLDPTSAVIPIAENLSPAIDMVISGHTHQPYVCDIPDPSGNSRLVTSASSFGRLFTDTELTYDRRTQDIVRASVTGVNKVVTRTVASDATEDALVLKYKTLIAPIATKVIGTIGTPVISRSQTDGESPLGDLIADSQLTDPSVVHGAKVPQIAFMNPGGIRTDLTSKDTTAPYDVTYEQAFAVQPFNNYVVSMDMTGAQIKQLLVQQWSGPNSGSANEKFLQVSDGFSYTYSGAAGSRVLGDVTFDDQPLDDSTVYRVVANSFLSDGGDSFPAFRLGQDKLIGGLDIDSLARYLTANPGYQPLTPGTRIVKTG